MSQVSTVPKLDATYAISAQQQLMSKPVGSLIDSPINPLI